MSKGTLDVAFGARLREIRKAAHRTEQDLANFLGVSKSAISKIERGQIKGPDPERLRLIAEFFGLKPKQSSLLLQPKGSPIPQSFFGEAPPANLAVIA